MELETLFSEQRWNIIRCLASEKHSPLQLAGKLNTTIANISQQLRLLQAADLVKIERVQSRAKGKPRKLFTLSNDYAYLISAMNEMTDKKLLELSDHHKTILRIWFIDDVDLHYVLEKLYWSLDKLLPQIQGMAVKTAAGKANVLFVADKGLQKQIDVCVKKLDSQDVRAKIIDRAEAAKLSGQDGVAVLFDKNSVFSSIQGGDAPVS